MSHTGSHQLTHQPPMLIPSTRLQRTVQIFTAVTLFFAMMTPVTYFIGRAYHDGWYDYLHLDQGMFPLDTSGMLIDGIEAWGDTVGLLANAVGKMLRVHWLWLIFLMASGGLIWSAFAYFFERLGNKRAKQKVEPTGHVESQRRRPLAAVFLRLLVIFLIFCFVYELIFGLTLAFALLTVPFFRLGAHEARIAADNNFKNAPVVTVKLPNGDLSEQREIGCGPQFCALWGSGYASTVPLSAITWVESSPPGNPLAIMAQNKSDGLATPAAGSSR
ncbi:hypothetical protein EKH79_03485 [Dyella dinghuensis]|uniref:Uncharacterized protein n=1 Tax=Dyella dinghuensis TaxID=1920169 RepID=A0A3S0WQ42_9GAMM|nr:hypothetical protein [Dyella dinghuensis]RUL65787.1 hypothetical protein EKH79_03485 [Dyella dinghuensis]